MTRRTCVQTAGCLRARAKAVVEFRAAIRLQPDFAAAHNNIGQALLVQGERENAIAAIRTAIRLQPDPAAAHVGLGHALLQTGQWEEATATYREVIQKNPDDPEGHYRLAWAQAFFPKRPSSDYAEELWQAGKAMELVKHVSRNDAINLYATLALAEYRSGHWVESLEASDRSMALRVDGNAYDLFLCAMAFWQKGEKDKARKWFDSAFERAKGDSSEDVELRQIWSEAAALLGTAGPESSAALAR